MKTIRDQVIEFHRVFRQPIGKVPSIPDAARVRLRLALITEEYLELMEAAVHPEDEEVLLALRITRGNLFDLARRCRLRVHMKNFVDAMADIDYVVEGTRLELGVSGPEVAEEVHRANMSKSIECYGCAGVGWPFCSVCDGTGRVVRYREEDGKVLKPENFQPPDIQGVLVRQGWRPCSCTHAPEQHLSRGECGIVGCYCTWDGVAYETNR